MKNAFVVTDVQNDFLPGGALPVPEGDRIIGPINRLLGLPFDLIMATKDWHPREHCSFASNHPGKSVGEHVRVGSIDQILWPVHCVQESPGSEFAPALRKDKLEAVFYKGTEPAIDSYSAFFDNAHFKSTGMGEFLKEKQVELLLFSGLATDYCVKFSVLDALRLGFKVCVIEDACKGIDPKTTLAAIQEMKKAGAVIVSSQALLSRGLGGLRSLVAGSE